MWITTGRRARGTGESVWILAAAGLLSLAAGPAWAFQAQIDKPRIQETIAPGQTISGSVTVTNQGREPVNLEVYLQDWEYAQGGSGDKEFTAPGTSSRSASEWIRYFPNKMSVAAGGAGKVDYTITVPPEAQGGHYAVLFFESLVGNAPVDQSGVAVQYVGRLGSLIEVEAAGTVQRTGDITDVAIGAVAPDRPLEINYTFRNTGNVVIRPKAYYNILDAAGRYLGRGEFEPLYTSPGGSGTAHTEWTGRLPSGEHTLLLTVDLGGAEPLVVERSLAAGR